MSDKYENAFNNAHGIKFDRFRFDEPEYDMLIVHDENDYLEHLRVQGAGLAYYSALAKQLERDFDELERRLKFRYNEMYAECSNILGREGKKTTVRDIESFVQTKYESELEKFYRQLDEIRSQRDYVVSFLEGWRQKSFILTSMTQMITSGLLAPKQTVTEEDMKSNLQHIKEILNRRNKEKKENQ